MEQENIEKSCLLISHNRLKKYKDIKGCWEHALRLHQLHGKINSTLFEIIANTEIVVRNASVESICAAHGLEEIFSPANYVRFKWSQKTKTDFETARSRIRDKEKEVTQERMIAEMSFGFWTNLYSPNRKKIFWDRCLIKFFPDKRIRIDNVHRNLSTIRMTRNRIAHHEHQGNKRLMEVIRSIKFLESEMVPVSETLKFLNQDAFIRLFGLVEEKQKIECEQ